MMRQPPQFAAGDAAEQFERAWSTASNTRFTVPSMRPNALLRRQTWSAGRAPRVTALMVWDSEVRKAREPVRYIPSIVSEARTWGHERHPDGTETFWRESQQRAWISGEPVRVIERAFVDATRRRILFLGAPAAVGPDGATIDATDQQPIFFVEHSVTGAEDDPEIQWRIVHLTEVPDERLVARISAVAAAAALPEYVSIYLSEVVGIGVSPGVTDVREPSARDVPASAVAWENPFGAQGPSIATLWGDRDQGAHGSLMRFQPAAPAALHVHPHHTWGVVIRGKMTHTVQGSAEGKTLTAGGWWFMPGGVPHVSTCGADEECVVLIHNPGPFGYQPR